MNLLLLLPIALPLATAALTLLLHRHRPAQRALGVAGAGGLLIAAGALLANVWRAGIQVAQIGNWPAPFGITLVADLFSAIMVLLAGLMGFAVAIYSLTTIDVRREAFGYYSLLHVLLMGVCGAFLTGDLFNLYVWFEVLLIASFVLLALGGERAQLEGGIKYVTLNLLSSALFLAAVGLLYAETGTLNLAHLAQRLALVQPGLVTTIAMLFLVAFGIKAAAFPLFFWLPASYHTPPVAVSAIFAGLLTKVGVYALVRVFTLLFINDVGYTHTLILVIAGLTMITGVLGAVAQNDFRRILSFHIVSQIGYMLMGLGLYTSLGLAGAVFYIIHHIIVKTNLFLISGVARRVSGSYHLQRTGGLYASHPTIAACFLISAFSLAGLPPFSGFFAKLALIRAGLETAQYAIVAVSLVVSFLTLFSMTKIWTEAFWKPAPPSAHALPEGGLNALQQGLAIMSLPIIALTLLSLLIGLGAGPALTLAQAAADQLLQPSGYIQIVMGGRP
ncbi:Na+/H+ antiporter subunit D [Kallotenue papyrolyticum]|uniref:Na+/H+ antiporter subunit D n=1 Tax=Kallotenue papyrolyticum TaxID=1325125 RepID=UPI0004926A20|nr:Na+/H+ antiporter subunit D [Kallotenue papyrolyticum]